MTTLTISKEKPSSNYNSKEEPDIIFRVAIPEKDTDILELIQVIAKKINELKAGAKEGEDARKV